MKKSNPSLTRIHTIIQNSLKSLNLETSFRVYPIWKQWTDLVGDAIAERTTPDYVRGKTLVVSVGNSVWMQELQLQKRTLLQKINSLNLEHPIEDIHFRMQKN